MRTDLSHLELGNNAYGDFTPKESKVASTLFKLARLKVGARASKYLHIEPASMLSARYGEGLWLDFKDWSIIFRTENDNLLSLLDQYIWVTCRVRTKSQLRNTAIITLIY